MKSDKNEFFSENLLVKFSGGLSNTPLTGQDIINDIKVNVSFDWFKFNTDRIIYSDNNYSDSVDVLLKNGRNDIILSQIVDFLSSEKKPYHDYELNRSLHERNYSFGLIIDEGISISLCGPASSNDRATTLTNLTGKGCYFFSKNKNYIKCWYDLFSFVIKNEMVGKRLDIAFDLMGGDEVNHFIYWLIEKIKNGSVRTRYHDNFNREVKSANEGYSLYLGSNTSSSKIRIYNKNAEKIDKDKNAFIFDDNYWRIEIELQDGNNNAVNSFLKSYINYFYNSIEKKTLIEQDLNDFNKFLLNFLNSYLEVRIKEPGVDIKYCEIDPLWNSFINLDKKITFSCGDNLRRTSIEIKKDWFNRSCFKALTQIYLTYGENEFFEWLKTGMLFAMGVFKDEEKKQISNFFLEKGIYTDLLTLENGKYIFDEKRLEKTKKELSNKCICWKMKS